jgi:ERCC4-type nuclease
MAETTEHEEKVRVVIDMREDSLWEILEPEEGYQLEKAPLDVGDIAFFVRQTDGTEKEVLTLERKSAEDLGASQRDGRYREQRARLLAKKGAGTAVGYMLETPVWSSDLSRSWCRGTFKEAHLLNTVMRLQLRYGIAVFQVRDVEETAMWIRHIAKALVADPKVFQDGLAETTAGAAAVYTEALHVKKATNMSTDRVLATLLRTVPGVGPAAADAIVAHVGSAGFPGFFGLSEADLAAIPQGTKRKVGAAVARKLWSTFHEIQPQLQTAM